MGDDVEKEYVYVFFFFKQKTAYEIGTSDWSSDVCSSDLGPEDPMQYLRSLVARAMALQSWVEKVERNSLLNEIGRASCRERV